MVQDPFLMLSFVADKQNDLRSSLSPTLIFITEYDLEDIDLSLKFLLSQIFLLIILYHFLYEYLHW